MFKKLKIKFIITMMILLTAILVAICSFLYYSSIKNNEEMLFSQMGMPNQWKKHESDSDAINEGLIIFVNNNMIQSYETSYELKEEDILNITNLVYKKVSKPGENKGFIEYNDESYAYIIEMKGPAGINTIFVRDAKLYNEYVFKLRLEVIAIGLGSWIAFLFVSIVIARKAIKPVEASYNAQKRFIADASHELKTPLAVIKTNLDLVESDKTQTIKSQEKWLDYISFQTDRMTKLVNDLLYLAKVDNKEQLGTEQEFILSDLIMNQALSFEAFTFENNLELKCDIDEDIKFYGDRERFNQLTGILLDNAIKYAHKNTIIILSLKVYKQKVRLIVQNEGNTIPKEDLLRIFDRFYRVDKARSREKGGYGLGLSIAKSIVKHYKGTIYAESENGTTKFIAEFPIKKSLPR